MRWEFSSSKLGYAVGGHWTCNSQVTGSSPGWAPSHSDLGQTTYAYVALSPSSIIWYRPKSGYIERLGR